MFAAFVASSLQGRVVCYADGGEHVAIEAPHGDTGCPDAHAGHDDAPVHEPKDDRCTDVTAEFSVSREAVRNCVDSYLPELAFAPPVAFVCPAPLPAQADEYVAGVSHPPESSDLGRLRTVVLLV